MRITRIRVYRTPLPYSGGTYVWGRGNVISTAWSSVVVIDTDAGFSGCGEFCPCGENYMEAHSHGVEAAARLLAPALLGKDPRQIGLIEQRMDSAVRGHHYAKSPFDIACWDLLGQATGQPVWMLLGGKLTDGVPLYRVAPQKQVDETAAEIERLRVGGYRHFQIKVGGDGTLDIDRIRATVPLLGSGEMAFADANQGWRVDEAIRVARATRDLDFILEQPCRTYEECQQVRRRTDLPMKLDESITGFKSLHRVIEDRGADIVCLKLSKQGGLSRSRRMRDLLVDHRIPVVAEDSWGGEVTTAALSHFAASTPEEFLVNTTDLHNYNSRSTGRPAPVTAGGRLYTSDAPGLGVTPDFAALGKPVFERGTVRMGSQ
ncbi:MAG: mandelate racemase/muconate lactonizing enzyme family protein [Paracoccaceae bacterium]|nr:mandelate racemase/muconate lactonizing enzyme family protein [Paracoccaceae bacterium]